MKRRFASGSRRGDVIDCYVKMCTVLSRRRRRRRPLGCLSSHSPKDTLARLALSYAPIAFCVALIWSRMMSVNMACGAMRT